MTALDLEAARARITELEREVQALMGECAMAYDVIDSLSEEQLALIPDAKLLAALRLMEREQRRDMAETSLQRQLTQARAALAGLIEAERRHIMCPFCGTYETGMASSGDGPSKTWPKSHAPSCPITLAAAALSSAEAERG